MRASQTHTAHKTDITETARHRNRHTEGQTQGQIHSQDSLQAGTNSDSLYNRGTEDGRYREREVENANPDSLFHKPLQGQKFLLLSLI